MRQRALRLGLLIALGTLTPLTAVWAQEGIDSAFGSDFGFEEIQANLISSSPSGEVSFSGNVDLKSEQLDVKCRELEVNPDARLIKAKGSPVKIRQQGIRAECRSYTYNMDTRKSLLEGDPVIYQEKGGKITKTTAGIITIVQDEDGKIGWNLEPGPNNIRPKIEVIENKSDGAAGDKKKPSGQRINKDDKKSLDLIKLPELE